MITCYITIDTEYEFGFTRRMGPFSRQDNFHRSILGTTASDEVGINYQMDVFDKYGLKAVFFVDPMPSLLWGTASVEDIVRPIVQRGHDVQLHIHTEWLELAGAANPLRNRTGANIKDFTFEEQCILLEYAKESLVAAGAPNPVAFRAGNYGANDDTLRALATLGLRYDSSHCPGISPSPSAISLTSADRAPVEHCGVVEVPTACIAGSWDEATLRHAQVTALSAREMLAAIEHSQIQGVEYFTIVSHSFELLSRDRTRINQVVRRRFEHLCAKMGRIAGATTGTYVSDPPQASNGGATSVLPFNPFRAAFRMLGQAASNALSSGSTRRSAASAAIAPRSPALMR